MTPPTRALGAWLDATRVGQLRDDGGAWTFTYDEAWRSAPDAFDLSPTLPRQAGEVLDGGANRPVQWFFDNLLPEEAARTALAADAGIDVADAFGLLHHYGRESAGALTLLAPGEPAAPGGLQPLADADLSERIRDLPHGPLVAGAPKRISIAGAQHKLAVVAGGNALWEPVGRTASTHILKPDHPDVDTYPHSVANEWFVMRLAKAIGLTVPRVEMRRVPEAVFLFERFDRTGKPGAASRLHAVDACRRKAATRLALFRWVVFNLVVGNGDAHLKNLSFLAGPRGIELAPHCDLLSTSAWRDPAWSHAELIAPIGTATRFGVVRRKDVVDFAGGMGLPAPLADRLLDELLSRILPTARAMSEAHGADRNALPGEARLLRQIAYGPIAGMTRQLND